MFRLVWSIERGGRGTLGRLAGVVSLLVCLVATACSGKIDGDDDDDDGSNGGTGGGLISGGRGGTGGGGRTSSGGSAGLAQTVTCPPGQSPCGGGCVSLASDSQHCGTCTNACGVGSACEVGACVTQCGAGQKLCGTSCKTVVSDPGNCGACGAACPVGQFCVSGACSATCNLASCATAAATECADVQTNPSHCGSCGMACTAGQSCVGGKCTQACPSGQSVCAGSCVDLQTNDASCGACGAACATGTPCIAGHCGCLTGETLCGGSCANFASDALHCGSCDKACPSGQVCQGGACAAGCTGGLTACDGGCVDTKTAASDCGVCGKTCAAAETCVNGSCACPSGEMLCGNACVNVQADAANCGACAKACGSGQTCLAGKCSCTGTLTACGTACVDTEVSNDHCGACSSPCTGGEACVGGECACPGAQDACSGACVDTATNAAHCGGCGQGCATGQTCSEGKCSGAGGVGADGCVGGLARNLSVSRIDAFQTVQVGIMLNGADVATSARNTDLIAGRETVFRVFVTPGSSWTTRELSARVTVVNGDTSDEFFAKKSVSGASSLGDAGSTFQVLVPAEKITDTSRYYVELVECTTSVTGEAVAPRYPDAEDSALGARVTGGLRVKIIPLRANSRVPPTDDASLEPYKAILAAMYPVDNVELTVGGEVSISYPLDWNGALDQVRAKRQADKPEADVYYYGLVKPNDTFQQFCGNGCTAGIGFLPDLNDSSRRVAMGIGFTGNQSTITMAHEVGHNHGRPHAPCVPQGGQIDGVDPEFPYDGASIGVWGYDARSQALINPTGITDIMGYCNNQWISDYTYDALVGRVVAVNADKRVVVNPDLLGLWRTLLIDERGPRWGLPVDELAPPAGTPEVAQIFDDQGDVKEYAVVYRTRVSDIGASSIMVPEPKPDWYAVSVDGAPAHPFAAPVAVPSP